MHIFVTTIALALLLLSTLARARPSRYVVDTPSNHLNFLTDLRHGRRSLHVAIHQANTSSSPAPLPKGYFFDECYSDDNCLGKRRCYRGDRMGWCDGELGCFCALQVPPENLQNNTPSDGTIPMLFQRCTRCKECAFYPEETCLLRFSDDDDAEGICGSAFTVYEGILRETDCNSYPESTQYVPEYANVPSPSSNQYKPGPNDFSYYSENNNPSISATPLPSPSPLEADICVDAALLAHLHPSALVYTSHRRAAVLCDAQGSCATPGHFVEHKQTPMTMRRYCDMVGGCQRRTRLVNSPRLQAGLRVSSRTMHLHFTPFAARYETKVEELFLRALIHMGY